MVAVTDVTAPRLPTFERDTLEIIQEALLIGLASFGEVHRLRAEFDSRKACGMPVEKELRPIVGGESDAIGTFATALHINAMAIKVCPPAGLMSAETF